MSIAARKIVNINPSVLGAGGSALILSGLILTDNTRAPLGSVLSFASLSAVTAYFGAGSIEETMAQVYFQGPDNASVRSGQLFFAQYNTADVAGYVRGGSGLTLAQVQAITSGTLTVTVNGTAKTSSALNLSGATSMSNAAALIQAAFTTPGFTVTYDSVAGAFVILSGTTGASSTIAITTGANATALKLTAATGAVTSNGAVTAVAATFMDTLVGSYQAWFAFTTTFEATVALGTSFAAWVSGRASRFAYVNWNTDAVNLTQNPTTNLAAIVAANTYAACIIVYAPVNTYKMGAFVLSWAASLNFAQTNGRKNLMFSAQEGLLADVTSDANYDILTTNKLSFYGGFSTAANGFTYMVNGFISGKFLWADSFANEVWLNDAMQVSLMSLLASVGNIPYNDDGYNLIRAALLGPIDAGLNFGAIRAGVTLTPSQQAQINDGAGNSDAADSVSSTGYFLGVTDPGATIRSQRKSPIINFWYADGQSVQQITFNSIEVQ